MQVLRHFEISTRQPPRRPIIVAIRTARHDARRMASGALVAVTVNVAARAVKRGPHRPRAHHCAKLPPWLPAITACQNSTTARRHQGSRYSCYARITTERTYCRSAASGVTVRGMRPIRPSPLKPRWLGGVRSTPPSPPPTDIRTIRRCCVAALLRSYGLIGNGAFRMT